LFVLLDEEDDPEPWLLTDAFFESDEQPARSVPAVTTDRTARSDPAIRF
jgi:hypothetical protein